MGNYIYIYTSFGEGGSVVVELRVMLNVPSPTIEMVGIIAVEHGVATSPS